MKALIAGLLLFFSSAIYIENSPVVLAKELECLAKNIYHEARGESIEGQIAVALVTLNRAEDNSICETVYRYKQFSWTIKPKGIFDKAAWHTSYKIAYNTIIYKNIYNFKATHYHANYVNPKWNLTPVAKIGKHVFYK